MSDSVRPHRQQPTRLPYPWDSPGKNTGVGCHFLLQCMKVKSESEVTQSCLPHGLQPTRLLHPWDFPGKSVVHLETGEASILTSSCFQGAAGNHQLSSACRCPAPGLCPHLSSPCPHVHTMSSFCLPSVHISPFYEDTLWIRVHSNDFIFP